jgi:MFS family permease
MTEQPGERVAHSARAVWALIFVETLSFLGSEISRFGVSVWIYQTTQSVYAFEMLLLANTVPGLIVAPLAGGIVDRSSRKRVMIGAATVSLTGTLLVLLGAALGELSMALIVGGAMLASVGEAFQWPALSASVPLMSTEADLPRYNGFLESGRAASMLAGPVIGGVLFAFLHLPGLLAVEVATFTVAVVVVSMLHIPRPTVVEAPEQGSLFKESMFGVAWIFAHKPLLKFLAVAVFANFFLSIGMVLMPPFGLGLLGERAYGVANGLFGGGMIAGGILYGFLCKRASNIQLFLWTSLLMGVLYAGYGFSRGVVVLSSINFVVATLMTIGNAGILTIWQKKVPEEYQGRVLSAVRMIAYGTGPLSYLLAGPLADRLAPALFEKSALLTTTWGSSKAAQIGFLFSAMGVLMFVGFLLATASKDVRGVEDPAPD